MSIKGYIIAFFLVCCSWALRAQDESHLYESALEAYELGMFEKVDTLLSKSVSSFQGESRIGVYRLLALSNLNWPGCWRSIPTTGCTMMSRASPKW